MSLTCMANCLSRASFRTDSMSPTAKPIWNYTNNNTNEYEENLRNNWNQDNTINKII